MEKIITIDDKRYPELLRRVGKEAPGKLYYKGEWPSGTTKDKSNIFANCLAVVGSRRMTSYGRKITEQLVNEIASAGVTIVSGFMYGGDEAAHKAAVVAGGRTIAVMPCGIDIIHPEYQEDLYNEILENKGLIISEYEGDFPPASWTYVRRNRIVAGLSKAALIVEAGLNSGTMITAELAKKFQRKIFVVPGPVTSEVSKGTNQLLKEGAVVVTEAKDILKYYDMSFVKTSLAKEAGSNLGKMGNLEQQIIEQLKIEPMEMDTLARILKVSISDLGSKLSLMQIKGFISQQGNKYCIDK